MSTYPLGNISFTIKSNEPNYQTKIGAVKEHVSSIKSKILTYRAESFNDTLISVEKDGYKSKNYYKVTVIRPDPPSRTGGGGSGGGGNDKNREPIGDHGGDIPGSDPEISNPV